LHSVDYTNLRCIGRGCTRTSCRLEIAMYLYQCVTHRGFHATAFSFYENYGVSGTGCRLRDKPREAASRTGITAERWSKSCGMTTEIAAIARRFRPVKVLKTGTAAPVVPSSSIPSNIE